MAGWGQIGAALFEGHEQKVWKKLQVREDEAYWRREREQYEARAEAARRQAEENKGKYTKQVGDLASRMKQISSVLLDVEERV